MTDADEWIRSRWQNGRAVPNGVNIDFFGRFEDRQENLLAGDKHTAGLYPADPTVQRIFRDIRRNIGKQAAPVARQHVLLEKMNT